MEEKRSTSQSVLRLFWRYICRYRALTAAILFLIVVAQGLSVLAPWYYKRFFDALAASSGKPVAVTVTALISILVIIAILRVGTQIAWRVSGLINNYFQTRIMADLEESAFQYLTGHSYQFFTDNFAGALVRRIQRLTRSFEDIADNIEWKGLPLLVTIVGGLIILFRRSPLISLALLVWVILFILLNYAVSKWKLKYDEKRAEKDSEKTGALSDAITNNINIKLFTGDRYEDRLFTKVVEEAQKLRLFTWNLSELNNAIQGMLMYAIEIIVMYIAIRLWAQGRLTFGDFALIQGYLVTLFDQLWDFGRVIRNTYESFADAKEMVDILELPHEIQDKPGAAKLRVTQGAMEFKNVSFTYNKTRSILRGFNLSIKPKEKVALVGASGAGKSTVMKLLMRFYDLDRGKILIDGQSIADVTQESLREQIAFVPQEPILFHRSLMENIRYGRRNATNTEVLDAARKAHCHEFIKRLPQGYDTLVGERGIKLSGGERQRVAIARAILKDTPILLLDEATSSLDSESEALIQDALHELMRQKTAVAIAHRLSTIMEMDRIVVMDKGKVVDEGTHESLLKKESIYRKLWEIQAGGFLP